MRKKEPICVDLTVVKHSHKEDADKEPVYNVALKSKLFAYGNGEATVSMTVKSSEETIFDEMPLKSERKIKLVDEQTTLE